MAGAYRRGGDGAGEAEGAVRRERSIQSLERNGGQ